MTATIQRTSSDRHGEHGPGGGSVVSIGFLSILVAVFGALVTSGLSAGFRRRRWVGRILSATRDVAIPRTPRAVTMTSLAAALTFAGLRPP